MTNKIDRCLIKVQTTEEDFPYHDNIRAIREIGPIRKYMSSALVPEANVWINVREVKQVPPDFKSHLEPHKHELNEVYGVIGDLTVEFGLDGERREVTGPASLFIPAGTAHFYRPLRGSGYVFVVYMSGNYDLPPL